MAALPVPAYHRRSLADLTPALLHAVGTPGFDDVVGVGEARRACLLLVDGLGGVLLQQHRELAPTLAAAAAAAEPLTTGFPSTTVASLSSIGTGVPPGEHGMVGYTMALPGCDRAVNMLRWTPLGDTADLSAEYPPRVVQPVTTAFERAAAAGVHVTSVSGKPYEGTPFTTAALRGGVYRGASSMEEVRDATIATLQGDTPLFIYAYTPELDMAGHLCGIDSEPWRDRLVAVERLVGEIAAALPPDTVLAVTGDHGMVDVPPAGRVDVADRPELLEGVRLLGGEARVRHVYTVDGAATSVAQTWRDVLGDGADVLLREEAVSAGLFGPAVRDAVLPRIGDVVMVAKAAIGVTDRAGDPMSATFTGNHGALTDAERLVPLALFHG